MSSQQKVARSHVAPHFGSQWAVFCFFGRGRVDSPFAMREGQAHVDDQCTTKFKIFWGKLTEETFTRELN